MVFNLEKHGIIDFVINVLGFLVGKIIFNTFWN